MPYLNFSAKWIKSVQMIIYIGFKVSPPFTNVFLTTMKLKLIIV